MTLASKKGRPGRIINIENYSHVLAYFARDNLQVESSAAISLRLFASIHRYDIHRFYKPDDVITHISSMENILEHHIKNNSDIKIIERFKSRVENARMRIPITQDRLDELQLKVQKLDASEWQRFSNWVKQKRKRASDRKTDAEKRTIKVSTLIFEELCSLKQLKPGTTWDELLLELISHSKY